MKFIRTYWFSIVCLSAIPAIAGKQALDQLSMSDIAFWVLLPITFIAIGVLIFMGGIHIAMKRPERGNDRIRAMFFIVALIIFLVGVISASITHNPVWHSTSRTVMFLGTIAMLLIFGNGCIINKKGVCTNE